MTDKPDSDSHDYPEEPKKKIYHGARLKQQEKDDIKKMKARP